MRFILLGGAGKVGEEFRALSLPKDVQVVTPSRATFDLEERAIAGMIAAEPWNGVINAAAYTVVDRAEREETIAFAVNAESRFAAETARRVSRKCRLSRESGRNGTMRIIASMTTIPSRIDRIRPALESVIGQTAPIEHIEVNVPYVCERTNEPYIMPTWLENMDRVKVFRTDDYGPITKVAPTFLRHEGDQHTYIWSADDDIAYPAKQLEMLCRCHRPEENRILCRHGGNFNSDGSITFMFGKFEVEMFEGFGTVLYPPACIGEDFLEYLRIASENADCRLSDDVVLSFYFSSRRIPIYLCNSPSATEPFYPTGSLAYSNEKDALGLQASGHLPRYKRVREFLSTRFPLVSDVFRGRR